MPVASRHARRTRTFYIAEICLSIPISLQREHHRPLPSLPRRGISYPVQKALNKAIDILEFLAAHPEQARPLGEIAQGLQIPPATCAGLMKTLVARGLADQPTPRGGYALGPLAYALASLGPWRKDLATAAEPVVAQTAVTLGELVVLLSLHRGRRYMLCRSEGDRMLRVHPDAIVYDDAYSMSTGRLLLAHLPRTLRESFITEHDLPGDRWPAIADIDDLHRTLDAIVAAGYAINLDHPDLVQIAVPVFQDGACVAALGSGVPAARCETRRRKEILATLRAASIEITRTIQAARTD